MDIDRELFVRLDEQVKRLVSDAKSEKDTRARTNDRIHEDITGLRKHMDSECQKLSERIDQECLKLSAQIAQRADTHGTQIKWLERMAWIAIGAFGLARWLFT